MSVHKLGHLIYHVDRAANMVHLEQDNVFYCCGRLVDAANDIKHTSIPDIYPLLPNTPTYHCPNPDKHDQSFNIEHKGTITPASS